MRGVGQILRKSSIFQPSVPIRAKSLHPLSLRLIHSKTAPLGKIGRKGALTPRLARTHRNTFQHFGAVRRADFILSTSIFQSSSYSFSHFLTSVFLFLVQVSSHFLCLHLFLCSALRFPNFNNQSLFFVQSYFHIFLFFSFLSASNSIRLIRCFYFRLICFQLC